MDTFKTGHAIKVMVSHTLKGKAPKSWAKADWAQYHKSFAETAVTPYGLAAEIWRGYSFTPIFNGRRTEENFTEAWHIAFDFDGDGAALDYLMRAQSFAWYFASFAYSTPSSTPEQPKSRVVFVFDQPITSPDRMRQIYLALAWRFNADGSFCDPQCKDPLRLYYGSPQCEVIGNWSMLATVPQGNGQSMVDLLIDEYAAANPPALKQTPITATTPPPDNFIAHVINKCLDKIRYAAPGERHLQRRNISRTIGGYVAAGHIDELTAIAMLTEVAIANTDDPKLARREVEDGLQYGKGEPLQIEWQPATPLGVLLT